MQRFKHTKLFYSIILLEGYVVLAAELLAIRLLLPFVGSSVETTSIVISGVLLPLAFGYHAGGKRYHKPFKTGGKVASVRALLLRNLLTSMLVYVFALSFLFLTLLFGVMQHLGIDNPLIQVTLYTVLFISGPTFLLGQTVPLVTNYLSSQQRSIMTGRILFFSTVGSFAGSVISTIILMNTIGVHNTAIVIVALLFIMVLLLARKLTQYEVVLATLLMAAMVALNGTSAMQLLSIDSTNAYNSVQIITDEEAGWKELRLNNNQSSRIAQQPDDRFAYIAFIEDAILKPAPKPLEVLVLGAGGFTLGWADTQRHKYRFVDIDPDLLAVSERGFLPEPLHANKQFTAQSARGYLEQHKNTRYDVIVVDVYTGPSIPLETVTLEFWQELDAHLHEGGIVAVNLILPTDLSNQFAQRIQHTFMQVFPRFHAQLVEAPEAINYWADARLNTLLIHRKHTKKGANATYHDSISTHSLDTLKTLY